MQKSPSTTPPATTTPPRRSQRLCKPRVNVDDNSTAAHSPDPTHRVSPTRPLKKTIMDHLVADDQPVASTSRLQLPSPSPVRKRKHRNEVDSPLGKKPKVSLAKDKGKGRAATIPDSSSGGYSYGNFTTTPSFTPHSSQTHYNTRKSSRRPAPLPIPRILTMDTRESTSLTLPKSVRRPRPQLIPSRNADVMTGRRTGRSQPASRAKSRGKGKSKSPLPSSSSSTTVSPLPAPFAKHSSLPPLTTTTPPTTPPTSPKKQSVVTLSALSPQSSHDDLETADLPLLARSLPSLTSLVLPVTPPQPQRGRSRARGTSPHNIPTRSPVRTRGRSRMLGVSSSPATLDVSTKSPLVANAAPSSTPIISGAPTTTSFELTSPSFAPLRPFEETEDEREVEEMMVDAHPVRDAPERTVSAESQSKDVIPKVESELEEQEVDENTAPPPTPPLQPLTTPVSPAPPLLQPTASLEDVMSLPCPDVPDLSPDPLPNPFEQHEEQQRLQLDFEDFTSPLSPSPSLSTISEPQTPRRLGAKGRRYVRGTVWELDRWGNWRPVDDGSGNSVLGGPVCGLGGMGSGGSGWGMWKATCKARVAILSSQIGAHSIRTHEAEIFGSPLSHTLFPASPSTTVLSPHSSPQPDLGEEGQEHEDDIEHDMDFSEEEMDWAYGDVDGDVDSDDEMEVEVEVDETEQERIMDINVVSEVGAEEGVYMEFSLPQTQVSVELGTPPAPSTVPGPSSPSPSSLLSPSPIIPRLEGIRLPELRLRDMDQFKAVFDMDAPAPPSSSVVGYDGGSNINMTSPLSLTHTEPSPSPSPSPSPTSTRKLHYRSRKFGSIASGTPVNPVTRKIWATGNGAVQPGADEFSSAGLGFPSTFESGGIGGLVFGGGGLDSDASISEGVHWGVLRRREPRPNHNQMIMNPEWQAGLFSNFADIVGTADESSGPDVGIGGGSSGIPGVPIDPVLQGTDGYMGMSGMGLYEGAGMGVGGATVGGFTFPSEQTPPSTTLSTSETSSTSSGSASPTSPTSSNTPQDFPTWGENHMVNVNANTGTGDINMGFSMSFNPMGFPVSPGSLTTTSNDSDSSHHHITSNQPSLTSSSTCSLGSVMSHHHHQQMTTMEELRNQSSQSPSPPLGYVAA